MTEKSVPKFVYQFTCSTCGIKITIPGDCGDCLQRKQEARIMGFIINRVDRAFETPVEYGKIVDL